MKISDIAKGGGKFKASMAQGVLIKNYIVPLNMAI